MNTLFLQFGTPFLIVLARAPFFLKAPFGKIMIPPFTHCSLLLNQQPNMTMPDQTAAESPAQHF